MRSTTISLKHVPHRFTILTYVLLFFFYFFLIPEIAGADCADELEDLEGYTIIAVKTIKGWYDEDERNDSSFNGCSHGRIIVFTDGTVLTCAEYGYMYAYRPTAIIFAREFSWKGKPIYDIKMLVEDEVFDMRR